MKPPPRTPPKRTPPPPDARTDVRRTYHRAKLRKINALVDQAAAWLDPIDFGIYVGLWRDTKPDGLARSGRDDLARRYRRSPARVGQAIRSLLDVRAIRLVYAPRQGLVAAYTLLGLEDLAAINPVAARIVAEREAAETPEDAAARRARAAAYRGRRDHQQEVRSTRRTLLRGGHHDPQAPTDVDV